jgi:hypothetical protein
MLPSLPDPVTACCFKGEPRRFRREPPPDDEPPPESSAPEPPLPFASADAGMNAMFAGMGCFTFLALLAIIILAHTPFVAN